MPDSRTELESIERDERPWGWFDQLALNTTCTVKVISVDPGEALSLQYHHNRDELWYVLDDGLRIQIDGTETVAHAGQVFLVGRGQEHRVVGGEHPGRFVEVAFGEFDEDDIVRTEDRYGRAVS